MKPMLETKLSYFDPRRKTEIIVDARSFGDRLIQIGKILSYAIRARCLTFADCRLQTTDYRLQNYRLQTAYSSLSIRLFFLAG